MKTMTLVTSVSAMFFSCALLAQETKNESAYPNDEIAFYVKDGVKMSLQDNTPLIFSNRKDPVQGATADAMAMDWIAQHQDELKVSDLSDLSVYAMRKGQAGANVRLRQYYQGLPVFQSEIVVHISPKNEVTYVTNNYDPSIDAINVSPALTSGEASGLAKEHIQAQGNINFESNELYVYSKEATTRLIYKIVLEPEAPLGSWEILVDAHSGNIIRSANKACNHREHNNAAMLAPPPVNGTGNVFRPDPLSVAQVSYGTPYADGSDAANAQLDATMSTVTLLDINFNGTDYELKGPYAEIVDFESPYKGLFSQASSVFDFNRSDDAFEAVNCYYHIDNSMRYINQVLGISLMPFQYGTGVRVDPSGLSGQDNSHYLGGSGNLAFGEGGVDDAEDADVVLHELGHGLHDWLTNGNLSQVNGLSEGCGDYWAVSYSKSLNQWTPADPQYEWVFSWDGHNTFWNGRVTNYTANYPGGLVGAIHTDGQIWASALHRIYEIVGREYVDKAFLEGLAMTGGSTNQQDAAIAVRQAAIDMNYPCEVIDVFTTEFTYTGYNMPALAQPSGVENSTICYGESITVNGTVYDANNTSGTEIIPGTTAACDSTVTVNITVLPALVSAINTTLCLGESMVVNGTTYDEGHPSGVEVFTNVGVHGCDSTVTINLTFAAGLSSTINDAICDGESIVVNGTSYDASNPSGTEVFTGAGAGGCDSTVTINLTVIPPVTSTITDNLCYTDHIVVNGTTYDVNNPSGSEVFSNGSVNGCDSTVTIDLTFDSAIDVTVTNNSPTLTANQAGATYQWIDCANGNTPISGATNQDFVATTNGAYAVQVTMGTCMETSSCETVANVGLDELNQSQITVYPNPSEGVFNIAIGDYVDVLNYSVTDLGGRIVRSERNIEAQQFNVDLATESKGVYLLRVTHTKGSQIFKLVLK